MVAVSAIPGATLAQRNPWIAFLTPIGAYTPVRINMQRPGALQAGKFLWRNIGSLFTAQPIYAGFHVVLRHFWRFRNGTACITGICRIHAGPFNVVFVLHTIRSPLREWIMTF